MVGEVKKITDKGFGFILAEDHKEYFVHRSGFKGDWDTLQQDMERNMKVPVRFEVEKSSKGPRATNVERLDAQ